MLKRISEFEEKRILLVRITFLIQPILKGMFYLAILFSAY